MYKDFRGCKVMALTASWVLSKHFHGKEWHHGFASSSLRDRKKSKNCKISLRWDSSHLTSDVYNVNAYV